MKKVLLCAAVLALSASCVDKDFDMSDINTDDIVIGGDESVFRLPLANISVLGEAVSADNGTYDSLQNIFDEADTWIPSKWTELSLARLNDQDQTYVDEIISALLEDMQSDDVKRAEVVRRIVESSSYASAVESSMPKNPETGEPLYSIDDYINNHFDEFEDDSRSVLTDIVNKHLESMTTCISEITEDVDDFGLDDDIVDLLSGEGTMRIYGTIFNALPIDCTGCTFTLASRYDEDVEVLNFSFDLGYNKTNPLDVPVYEHNLRGMVGDMKLTVKFEPTIYYPLRGKPLPADDETALSLTLKLEKTGGLNIGELM